MNANVWVPLMFCPQDSISAIFEKRVMDQRTHGHSLSRGTLHLTLANFISHRLAVSMFQLRVGVRLFPL